MRILVRRFELYEVELSDEKAIMQACIAEDIDWCTLCERKPSEGHAEECPLVQSGAVVVSETIETSEL